MFKLILLVIIVLFFIAGIFGLRIYELSRVTAGDKIENGLKNKSALLVLDVQEDTMKIKEYGDTSLLMSNINTVIRKAQDNKIDIIYIKQEFSNPIDKLLAGGKYEQGTKGSELSNQLDVLSSTIFVKEKTDAFSNRELEEHLLNEQITTLYVIGADAAACIYKTSLGGVNRGYEVIVLRDAIFSVNDRFLEKSIENYRKNNIKISVLDKFPK